MTAPHRKTRGVLHFGGAAMTIDLRIDARPLVDVARLYRQVPGKVVKAEARAVRHTGQKARTQVRIALAKQTGLKAALLNRALRGKMRAAAAFEIRSRGGDINLRYFGATERGPGVLAAVRGVSQIWVGAFMRGGWEGERVPIPSLHGNVFHRAGGNRLPIEPSKSGVIIPGEMLRDASLAAFNRVVAADLPTRILHELDRLL